MEAIKIDCLELDDAGKPVYLHTRDCPGYCDYACNAPQGDQVAETLANLIKEVEQLTRTNPWIAV